VNARIRQQLEQRKRRIARRLRKTNWQRPATLGSVNAHYEIADRTRAISAGGIGLIDLVVKRTGLAESINERLHLLKVHLPYSESDHVLSIAYNVLAGGQCLEHLELLRNNEVFLDALGAQRIPDPTTAGDFCRRFSRRDLETLMDVINETRIKVWQQQGPEFFEQAVIDVDGTMVETTGECKFGMDINYQGQWGYHPLIISLANTAEPLLIVNRSGNRPSHDEAPEYLDRAIEVCRRGGFRQILLRGDTDFSLTEHFDRWEEDGVKFVFGLDATEQLYELAENLPISAWKILKRRAKHTVKTTPRGRHVRVKERIVKEREFENIHLRREYVAEFRYRPTRCSRAYRVVVVWKDLEVHAGQRKLFDDTRCFFYITNCWNGPAEDVVYNAHDRCNQENTVLEQLKNGVRAATAPLDNLLSNWAYMVIASLAWSLKAWVGLLLPAEGRWREKHAQQKQRVLRMEFHTFRQAWINIPAQIIRTSRRIIYRFLSWNQWQPAFFRLLDVLQTPLRC